MSKTLKRPMFRMGGDTNSGIMSGFERKNFNQGSQPIPGGESTSIQDVPLNIAFPVDPKAVQTMANLINRNRDIAASNLEQTSTATPSMSMQEKFGQMVGPVPDEFQRGFGLSEYLALVKLGAGIAGAPNQGKGFKNFVRSSAPAFGQFAEDIGALDRAKTVQRENIKQRVTEAEQKGAELLNLSRSQVFAINKGKSNGSSTYFKRILFEILDYFDDKGDVPSIVGFLSKIEAENSEEKRQELEKEVEKYNRVMARVGDLYKRNPNYNFIKLEGFIPQIIDEETDLIR